MNKHISPRGNFKTVIQQTSVLSGPVPSPAILREYDNLLPGSAQKIFEMAENQSAHRMELEKKVINADINRSKQGLMFGFSVALFGIIGTIVLGIWGNPVVSGILGFSTLGSLVGVFIYGSQNRTAEREKRRDPGP